MKVSFSKGGKKCHVCSCARKFLIKPTLIEQEKKISISCAAICLPCFLKHSYLLNEVGDNTFHIKDEAWEQLD